MSDVQSNVKPLTLTTGRVIFAIAGVYVTQSLVSALFRLFSIPEALQIAFPKGFDFLCRASAVQHRKFITAHSVGLAILLCHFFQHRPKAPQILIPDIMPVLIVDRFEIVQIQTDQP